MDKPRDAGDYYREHEEEARRLAIVVEELEKDEKLTHASKSFRASLKLILDHQRLKLERARYVGD